MNIITVENLNLYYGKFQALNNINLYIKEKKITALIGPSGCGKSTLLRTFNRTNDLIANVEIKGKVIIDGKNILKNNIDIVKLRRKVGMVFQRPNAFPLSIYENIAFGLRIHKMIKNKTRLNYLVEESLKAVFLWNDLKDKLKKSALILSTEQEQRLCIARLLVTKPDIILMDEPCSTLDPIATMKIEELIVELKKQYTIVIVTHNMQQASRISDDVGFMLLGKLIESGSTKTIFTKPKKKETEDYITGKFG